jgi:hypothetical protein
MICTHCKHRYEANHAATYPGGFEAPGVFFYFALILTCITFLLFIFQIAIIPWIILGITFFVLLNVWRSWSLCHGASGCSETGGETCPICGYKNRIYPWSF